MEKIGIGVITYNRKETLKHTLNKILENTTGKYKLIVADDYSTDGTLEFLAQSNVAYVTGKNSGVCINKSRALYHLRDCDYIYLIEDDVFPIIKGWQNVYIEAIKESGIQYFSRTLESWDIERRHLKHCTQKLKDSPFHNSKFTYLESTGCPGQVYVLTKKVLEKVGGPSIDFKGYGHGHGDWTYRIKKSGLTGRRFAYKQIDVLEGRGVFKANSTLETITEESKREKQLERNEQVKRKKRSYYASTGDFYCGDYLTVRDAIQNVEFFEKENL